MKLLLDLVSSKETDNYDQTIDIAKNLSGEYKEPVIFHAYWKGSLSLHHLISITSCYYFNIKNNPQNKIILWIEDVNFNNPNKYNKEISKFAEIKIFSLKDEVKGTLLEKDHSFFPNSVRLSNLIRTILLYKYGGCWFDLDVFFLRSFEPIFANYSEEICLYNWEYQDYPNNAIYISLKPYSKKMEENIKYIMSLKRGWSFQQAMLTYDLPLDILILPCSWFDGSWVKNTYNIPFQNVFKKTKDEIQFDNFFNGSFCYHWHNQWTTTIHEKSPLYQLYQIILSNL